MTNAQFGSPISLQGIQGDRGLQGIAGFSVLAMAGPPLDSVGNVGDIYVDLDAGLLYAPKTQSGWPSATRSLVGAVGPQGIVGPVGASLLNGYGPPADSIGSDGDSYFNQQNASIFGPKASGKWPTAFSSLIGPAGNSGSAGTMILAANGAPNDSQGVDGDFFVDTEIGSLYGPKLNGSWGNGLSLIGPMGLTGGKGDTGLSGADGATIITGSGAPSTQGKPGDFYFDNTGSAIYGPRSSAINQPWPVQGFSIVGAQGVAGPMGPGGMMGADGKTLRSGVTDPDASLGDDGDYYFNATSGYLIGPKTNGAWPTPGFLLKGPSGDVGPSGPQGSQGIQGPGILSGSGAPSNDLGTVGSFYIDSVAFVVYGPKTSDAMTPWGRTTNIVGPQGPAGAASTVAGPAGPAGAVGAQGFSVQSGQGAPPSSLGNNGDLYVDLAGPNLYGAKANGAWPTTFESLAGAPGPAGAASTVPGPSGAQGASLLTGGGAPSSSYGNVGDSYIDINAGALYGAKTANGWPSAFKSLIGPTGQAGAVGAAGADGTVLRYGNGAPTSATFAHDGDFYIDQIASKLYGPRASGSFPGAGVSLVGPTGANGSVILTGNGPPPSGSGSIGDVYLDLVAGALYGNKTQNGWPSSSTSLIGPAGTAGAAGATIQTGQGAPASSLGNVGDIYVDLADGYLFGSKTASGWPTTYTSLIGPRGTAGAMGAQGVAGFSVQSGSGAPAAALGNIGDIYVDLTNGNLYGAKTSSGWPTTFKSLVGAVGPQGPAGAAGSNATVPNDLVGNSLTLAPVSGDTNAVQASVANSSGKVWSVDASGNQIVKGTQNVTGAATFGAAITATGTAAITGAASAYAFTSNAAGNATNPAYGFYGQFQGTNSGVYAAGHYFDANYGGIYESTNGYNVRSVTYSNGTPGNTDRSYVTHNLASGVGGSLVAYNFYVGGGTGLALRILGSGASTFSAALGVGGLTTTAGLTLSSGAITFADGTTLASATIANQAAYKASSAGTAAAPAHAYTGATNGAGLYFDAIGNDYLSVNGYKSLYSTAASGAASGANGWALASTLGSGSAIWSLFGAASATTPVFSVDGAGAVTAANVTLASGGKVTFADGTVQSTAATSSGGSSGSTGTQMRYGTGAPTTANPATQNDGDSYIDQAQSMLYGPRANGVWPSPISLIGPSGPAGYTSLTTQAMTTGQFLAVTNAAMTSTAQVFPMPGTTAPSYFVPAAPSALVGFSAEIGGSGSSATMTLYNVTTSTSVLSITLAASTGYVANVYTATQYPLAQNNVYQWQLTGSGTATYLTLQPYYLAPSAGPTGAVCSIEGFWSAAGTAFSTTAYQCPNYGIANAYGGWHPVRTASLYRLKMTYVPSTSGAAAASLTVLAKYYNYSTGSFVNLTTGTVTNTGLPQYAGPFTVGTYVIPAAQSTVVSATGTGTGQLFVALEMVI